MFKFPWKMSKNVSSIVGWWMNYCTIFVHSLAELWIAILLRLKFYVYERTKCKWHTICMSYFSSSSGCCAHENSPNKWISWCENMQIKISKKFLSCYRISFFRYCPMTTAAYVYILSTKCFWLLHVHAFISLLGCCCCLLFIFLLLILHQLYVKALTLSFNFIWNHKKP